MQLSNSSDSCILREREVVSHVNQVFDEIPVPNTSLNQAQMARVDLVCETNPSILSKGPILSSGHQVFDEMSQPVLNPHQDNNSLMSYFDNNDEIQVNDGISSSQNQHLMDELNGFRGETDSHFIEEIQQPIAYKMLDELPLSLFIKEMAQAASIVEENTPEIKADAKGLEYLHSPLLHAGSLISGCSLSQVTTNPFLSFVGLENEMFCWGVVNVDHDDLLCSMILEPTCRYQGVLFLLSSMAGKDPCLSFFDFKIGWKAKINYKEVHSWGKLYPTLGLWSKIWPLHFQYDPVMSFQRVDYIVEVVRLYPSNLHKLVLCVGIALIFNACELLLVFIGFEKQLTKKWLQVLFKPQNNTFLEIMTTYCNIRWIKLALTCSFSPTLEDKGDFRGEEDMVNVKCLWSLLNTPFLWSKCIYDHTNARSFVNCVFDPGREVLKVPEDCDTLLQIFSCIGIQCHKEIESQVKVFAPGCILGNIVASCVTPIQNNFKSIPYETGGIGILSACNLIALIVSGDGIGLGLKFPTMLSMHLYVQRDRELTLEYLLVSEKYPCLCSTINLRGEVPFDELNAVHQGILFGRISLTNIDFEEVGDNNVLALRRTQKYAVHLTFSCHTLMIATVYSFGIDRGGVKYELYFTIDLIVYGGCGIDLGLKFSAKPLFFTPSNSEIRLLMQFYMQRDWNFTLKCLLVNEECPGSCSTIYLRRKVHFDYLDVYEGILPGRRLVDFKRANIGFLRKGIVCTRFGVTSFFIFEPGDYDNGLWMMGSPQTDQRGVKQPKAMRYENHQAYIFDPGGSLLRFVIDAMMRKSQPGIVECLMLCLASSITCL